MPLNGMVGRSRQISRESGQPFMWVDTASNNDSDNEYESHEQWSALTWPVHGARSSWESTHNSATQHMTLGLCRKRPALIVFIYSVNASIASSMHTLGRLH